MPIGALIGGQPIWLIMVLGSILGLTMAWGYLS